MLKGIPYSSPTTLISIQMAPSSSRTQAGSTTECRLTNLLSNIEEWFILLFFYYVNFLCRNHFLIMLEGEDTGRLLRYDIATRSTHVVLDGLTFPNGVQLSKDQTFLLFTETTNCRYRFLYKRLSLGGKAKKKRMFV